MSYTIHWESKGVYVHFDDVFSLQNNELATNEVYGDSRIDDVKYAIWDFTDVKSYTMTEYDVKKPAAVDKGASYYLKEMTVLMAAKDEYAKQLCQEYIKVSKSLKTVWDFYLFDSMDEVRSYLVKAGLTA